MSASVTKFKTFMINFLGEIIEANPAIDCQLLSNLQMWIQFMADDKTMRETMQIIDQHRFQIRDVDFFLSYAPLREWLSQFISEAEFDNLAGQLWTNNDQEFRDSMYQWLDAMIKLV